MPASGGLRAGVAGYRAVMSNPQQPEIGRSRKTAAQEQDAASASVEVSGSDTVDEPAGPVPEANAPGHRPERDQDKPDLDAFASRLGMGEASGAGEEE